jgi:hypothetical protein
MIQSGGKEGQLCIDQAARVSSAADEIVYRDAFEIRESNGKPGATMTFQ